MRQDQGRRQCNANDQETTSQGLGALTSPKQSSQPPWSKAEIRIFIRTGAPNFKLYLDALPDLVARKVKAIEFASGRIIAEASGPDENLLNELHDKVIAAFGEDFYRQDHWGRQMKHVDPEDLVMFKLYYSPSHRKAGKRGHSPPGS